MSIARRPQRKPYFGKMVTKNLTESSFIGVTPQVQTYGRIGMCNAAAISNMYRNGYVFRPTTKKYPKEGNIGMFHDLTE